MIQEVDGFGKEKFLLDQLETLVHYVKSILYIYMFFVMQGACNWIYVLDFILKGLYKMLEFFLFARIAK